MERSSRNFQPSSSQRKFQAKFASPNRYFTENSRWVPLLNVGKLTSYCISRCVQFSLQSPKDCEKRLAIVYNGKRSEWSPIRSVIIRVINKIRICLITSVITARGPGITDRIGRHEVLLSINRNRYNFRENKCFLFWLKSI